MIVTSRKKLKKTTGGYQPEDSAKVTTPPTSGSNAVKPTRNEDRLDGAVELLTRILSYSEHMENFDRYDCKAVSVDNVQKAFDEYRKHIQREGDYNIEQQK